MGETMNIRRLLLDVDKALARPSVLEIAQAIEECTGVEALNITVTEIDMETVGMDITIERGNLDYEALVRAIESTGAVVHSLDELVAGRRTIEHTERLR
jgi:hypothetical protein